MRRGRYTQQLREHELEQQRNARGGGVGLFGGGGFPTAMGQLATRSRINTNVVANPGAWMCRTSCQTVGAINGTAQLGFCNWYADIGGEHPSGNAIGITAGIEYPAGTFTPITYSGIAQGSAPDNTTLLSDPFALNIPANTQFWRRYFLTPSTRICFQNGLSQGVQPWFAGGDAWHFPGTDQTLGGVVTDSGSGSSIWGTFLVGMTNQRNAFYFGDSRCVGVFDATQSAPGYSGCIERPLGAQAPFFNMATPGDTTITFLGSHALRLAIAQAYSNTGVIEWGINEARAGIAVATQINNYNAVAALLTGKQLFGSTVDTNTNGAWTLANGADQIPIASVVATRPGYNAAWRATPGGLIVGYRSYFELANQSCLGGPPDNGLWNANGAVNTFTGDGLHQKTAQNVLYVLNYPPP